MMEVDVLELLITIMMLIIVIFLVPMMIHIKNASQRFDQFLRETERDLFPMLRELREASERINRTSAKAEEGVGKAVGLAEALEEVGESIHGVNSFLRHDVGRYAGNLAGLWLGFRSASKVFLKQLAKERKGGD